MGICYKFFCPKKYYNNQNKENNDKKRFKLQISVSPASELIQMNKQRNVNQGLVNLNNSSINKSSEYMNSSNFPFTNKQSIKMLNISNQTPKLKYSSSMSRSKLIRTVRTQKYLIKSFSKKKKNYIFTNLKDKLICYFCGGKDCKYENYLTNKHIPNAIKGLNSNFITENVIVGQRPSNILILQFNLIDQFKKNNIGLIINLQKEGEHPYCGPNAYNLSKTGFSYNPSSFSGNDIQVKFFNYQEIKSQLSVNYILKIVKEMSICVYNKKQKVYVHCHSGCKRSGVIVACYLIYTTNENVDNVIQFINEKRDCFIQGKNERNQIKIFSEFIQTSRIIYGKKEKIDVYLKRQDDILYGDDSEKFGYVPRIITLSLEKILEIKIKYNLENIVIIKLLKGLINDWNNELENMLYLIKQNINKNDWRIFTINENLYIFVELLFDFCEDSTFYIINPEKIDILIKFGPFAKFLQQNNFFLTEQQKINILSFVRKVFFGFEYSVIFQIASFCSILFENNKKDNFQILFSEMIDRFSMELLGYNLCDIQNLKSEDEIYSNLIGNRICALSSIISLISHEILEPKNYDNGEKNKLKIFLFPTKAISPFISIINKYKRNSNPISSFEINLNQRNSVINNNHDESFKGLLENEESNEEKQIKNIFYNNKVPNKKENLQNTNIDNTATFQNFPITKSKINIVLSKSQSSLLTFKRDLNNSLDINISNNSINFKRPYNKSTKIKSQCPSLIKEIGIYKGRKSSDYMGIILK